MDNAYSSASRGQPTETSITQGLPPSRVDDKEGELPDLRAKSPQQRSGLLGTALLDFSHALLGAVQIFVLLSVVPRFKRTFADFGMKLPWVTEILIDISDVVVDFWFLLPLALAPLLVSDFAALYLLRRQEKTRVWARIWFYSILLLLLAGGGVIAIAIFLPLIELMEGLSR